MSLFRNPRPFQRWQWNEITAPLRRELLAVLLAAALAPTSPARGQTAALTGPILLPGDATSQPAAGQQWSPEIAAGAGGFLAVWVDARTSTVALPENITGGAVFDNENGSLHDIYAARLDASGAVIDAAPIVVAQQRLHQALPSVAFNGENWLVVWSGQEGIACCPDINVYAARVTPQGIVLDQEPIVVDTDDTNNGLYWPTVESDGENWIVVWRDLDASAGIFTLDAARISPAGVVLDPGGRRVRRDSHNSYPVSPDLAFAGDRFLLTWSEDSGEVMGQLLTPGLDPLGGVIRINLYAPSTGLFPRVASDGTDFLVAFWEDRYFGWSQLRCARVNHDGAVLDPAGIELTEAYGYTNYHPAVAWDGAYYFVVFDHDAFQPDVRAARVTTGGAVLDFNGFTVEADPALQNEAAAAPAPGGGVMALWKDYRHAGTQPGDIYGRRISRVAQVHPLTPIALGAPRQSEPDIARNAGGYLVVFRSVTALGARILAQRVTEGGGAIDLDPIELARGPDSIQNPAVAFNGTVYLIVWEQGTVTYGRRLGADGSLLDAGPFVVLPGEMPDVAALGDLFLVVSSHEDPHEIRQIKGARVRGSDGSVIDSTPVLLGQSFALWPRTESLGDRWLVVFERYPSHDNPRSDIYGNFLSPSGSPGSVFAVHSSAIPSERRAHLAIAGSYALIVWADGRPGPEYEDIYGRRLDANGTFLDPAAFPIVTAANEQWDPALAWDGSRFVLHHWDSRTDHEYAQHRGDTWGALLDAAGQPIDPAGFAVFADSIPELQPAVAAGFGNALLAAAVFRPDAPYTAYRISLRVQDPPASGTPETEGFRRLTVRLGPNPSTGEVTFWLDLPGTGSVEADVFHSDGRLVRRFAQDREAGRHSWIWDGRDSRGRWVTPGVYLVRVRANAEERVFKLVRRAR